MIKTIGMLELNSIAKGFETADKVVKGGEVELLMARPICPGKFLILITGNVGAVKYAIETGTIIAGPNLVDKLLLPNVHDEVIPAISGATDISKIKDIGIMEFFSMAASIVAADAAVKAANVDLIGITLGIGIGGKAFVILTGEVSAVESAIKSGIRSSLDCGMLVNKTVISGPDKQLLRFIF